MNLLYLKENPYFLKNFEEFSFYLDYLVNPVYLGNDGKKLLISAMLTLLSRL